jgi:hydroxypyruvate isomerase
MLGAFPAGTKKNENQCKHPAIMQAIICNGFKGFVAEEFIPTWPDELSVLKQVV